MSSPLRPYFKMMSLDPDDIKEILSENIDGVGARYLMVPFCGVVAEHVCFNIFIDLPIRLRQLYAVDEVSVDLLDLEASQTGSTLAV